MLLASFLVPVALLFFISGALYTLGVKGGVAKKSFAVELEKPFEPNLELLSQAAVKALGDRKLILPGGDPYLKKSKKGYRFRWDDLRYSVTIVANKDNRTLDLTYRERSVLTQVMRVHRGEAGSKLKIVSIAAAIGLLFVFVTGLYMAYTMPKFRNPSLVATALGLLTLLAVLVA
jgi:hypothetical protein